MMDSHRLAPANLIAEQQEKARRVKEAKEASLAITRNAERTGTKPPPYEFLELIGKGTFGRVYKCHDKTTGDLVAIKILQTDEQDYSADKSAKDDTIRDFKKEVSILQQLKDSKSRNVNIIHDAFDMHSQLWIVSDYCTGGSVRTLMRPLNQGGRPKGLGEEFIIPIARELAKAVADMHSIGIIHRDIKCANVYITERGEIQLGDFGIVGVVEDGVSKRNTVVGTPHWMPKEIARPMVENEDTKDPYGKEVDIWSYGCTVYEMAVGAPPNWTKQGYSMVESLEDSAPRLEGGDFSSNLREFVAFCLNSDPSDRPTADQVTRHPFVEETEDAHPNSNLVRLIERFMVWEHGGGSRSSLWMASPADPRIIAGNEEGERQNLEEVEDWNFSTSDNFDHEFGKRLSAMFSDGSFPRESPDVLSMYPQKTSMAERIRQEHHQKAVNRGEKSVMRIFEPDSEYDLRAPAAPVAPTPHPVDSDLPLRTFTSDAPTRESMIEIDLDEAHSRGEGSAQAYLDQFADFTDEPTIKGRSRENEDELYLYQEGDRDEKRDTRAWKFPSETSAPAQPAEEPPKEKRVTMEWRFPSAASTEKSSLEDKRDTRAWTFGNAGPAQINDDGPEFPFGGHSARQSEDFSQRLPPSLSRTSTEPIARTRNLSYTLSDSVPTSASFKRDSGESLIDLDAGLVDSIELVRPSTASSANESTMTDTTSGNPFDLEEDPAQNERDRDRFSYHKQWQSEGGRTQSYGRKPKQMHARGNSLSSTGSDNSPATSAFNDGFMRQSPIRARSQLSNHGGNINHGVPNQWPHLSNDNPGHYPLYTNDAFNPNQPGFPLGTHAGTVGAQHPRQQNSESRIRDAAMAYFDGPHPGAMLDNADPQMVEDELDRMCVLLEDGFEQMIKALRLSVPFDTREVQEQGAMSGFDSGVESNVTLSEDDGKPAHLTISQRPSRAPDSKSPQLPAFDFQ